MQVWARRLLCKNGRSLSAIFLVGTTACFNLAGCGYFDGDIVKTLNLTSRASSLAGADSTEVQKAGITSPLSLNISGTTYFLDPVSGSDSFSGLTASAAKQTLSFLVTGTTYYVSSSTGNDANPGTLAQPFATLQKASTVIAPGDRVLVRGGQYLEELVVPMSGTSANPIIFEAYPNEEPVISGADFAPRWARLDQFEHNTYSSPIFFYDGFESGHINTADALPYFLSKTHFNGSDISVGYQMTIQSSVVANGSSKTLRIETLPAAGNYDNARVNKTFSSTPQDTVYARGYFRIESGFSMADLASGRLLDVMVLRLGTGSTGKRLRVSFRRTTTTGKIVVVAGSYDTASNQSSGSGTAICPAVVNSGMSEGGGCGTIIPGTWNAIEVRYVGNSTSGGAELWLNGTKTSTLALSQDTTGLSVDRVEWGVNALGTTPPAPGSIMYLDDVVVSQNPIGLFQSFSSNPNAASTYATVYNVNGTSKQVFVSDTLNTNEKRLLNLDPASSNLSDLLNLDLTSAAVQDYEGAFYLDDPNNILYVRLKGGIDPSTKTVETGRRDYGALLLGNKDANSRPLSPPMQHVFIKGLHFKMFQRGTAGGIHLDNASNNFILFNKSRLNLESGIRVTWSSSYNTILGNTLSENKELFGSGVRLDLGSSDNLVCHNDIEGPDGNGLFLRGVVNVKETDGSSTDVVAPVERNTLCYNKLHNLTDSGVYATYKSNSNLIFGNLIKDIYYHVKDNGENSGGNGIHIASNSSGNKIYNNLIETTETHGVCLRQGALNTEVFNNSIYDVGRKIDPSTGLGQGSGISMHMSSAPASGYSYNSGNLVFNNIFALARSGCFTVDNMTVAQGLRNFFDYNICFNPSGTFLGVPGSGIFGKWNGQVAQDLGSFVKIAQPRDLSRPFNIFSLQTDPQFTDPGNDDFSLKAESPAWTSGIPSSKDLDL